MPSLEKRRGRRRLITLSQPTEAINAPSVAAAPAAVFGLLVGAGRRAVAIGFVSPMEFERQAGLAQAGVNRTGCRPIDYAFMGQDPDAADNRWLREAFENQVPIIYFLGIAPGRYQAMLPTFISGWDGKALKARVSFGAPEQATLTPPETALERRYALRAVKQRLHQASFREAVITAYKGRCALSGLPESLLLDAAHIVADKDEQLGQPVVPNGIPLSKIHHAAFDAHLIGIDPNYRLHVSDRLLDQNDGPMLEALKGLNGGTIHLPGRNRDRAAAWDRGMAQE